jgi:hypothetical protein
VTGGRRRSLSPPRSASPPSTPAPTTSLRNCRRKSQVGAALPGSMYTAACRLAGARRTPAREHRRGAANAVGEELGERRPGQPPGARTRAWEQSSGGIGERTKGAEIGGPRELRRHPPRARAGRGIRRPLLPMPASHASAVPGRGRACPTSPAGHPLLETSDGRIPPATS